jgi:Fe2+ transport system protein B
LRYTLTSFGFRPFILFTTSEVLWTTEPQPNCHLNRHQTRKSHNSPVFNALTGLRQHTGNWPGKTVTRAEGGFSYEGARYKLIDLPGTYSLSAMSLDEEIARDFILFGRPDVTVVVVDATRLERNLNLAARHGFKVDATRLEQELGVPVVPTSARSGQGIDQLNRTIADVANGRVTCQPYRISKRSAALQEVGGTRTSETRPQLFSIQRGDVREGDLFGTEGFGQMAKIDSHRTFAP